MTWHRVKSGSSEGRIKKPRREVPCVSRSTGLPDIAYMMLPGMMATQWSANIYHDGGHKIAVEFRVDGDYSVRQTSATSFTVRINMPRKLVPLIPFGRHDIQFTTDPEGFLVFDLQTLA